MTEPTTRVESDRPVLSVLRRMRPDELDVVIPEQVDRLRDMARSAQARTAHSTVTMVRPTTPSTKRAGPTASPSTNAPAEKAPTTGQ